MNLTRVASIATIVTYIVTCSLYKRTINMSYPFSAMECGGEQKFNITKESITNA